MNDPGLATQLTDALVDGDAAAVGACYRSDAHMTALLPRGVDDYDGRAAIVDAFTRWFGHERVEVVDASSEPIADGLRVSYRLHTVGPRGDCLIEQQQYVSVRDGRIGTARLLCSGFRQVACAA